jgi:hypothetical protein
MTRRLTTKQREELYDAEVAKARAAGRGDFPICNLCGVGIFPGQKWHVSHDPHRPRALGGEPSTASPMIAATLNIITRMTPAYRQGQSHPPEAHRRLSV